MKDKAFSFKAPLLVDISITFRCNLRCVHCLYSCEISRQEMKKDDIFRLIDECHEMGVFGISINGGEPTLHPDFWNILKYINKKEMEIVLTTNGTTLYPQDFKKFSKLKKISCIRFSLDSLNKEIFEWFRGRKNIYEKVIKNINYSTKFRYQTNILSTISKMNKNEVERLIYFADEIGVDGINLFPMIPVGRGKLHKNIILSKKEFKEFLEKIVSIKRLNKLKKVKILTDNPLMALLDYKYAKETRICPAGVISISVSPTGDVYPCPYFPTPCENIFKDSLEKIWRESELLNKLRSEKHLSHKCQMCIFKNSCRGGCRAMAFMYFGGINHEDPFCWI